MRDISLLFFLSISSRTHCHNSILENPSFDEQVQEKIIGSHLDSFCLYTSPLESWVERRLDVGLPLSITLSEVQPQSSVNFELSINPEPEFEQKSNLKDGLLDPVKSWNANEDLAKQVAEMFADHMDTDLIVLKTVKSQIQPKCRHPKKLRDKDREGNLYCMGCNLDL